MKQKTDQSWIYYVGGGSGYGLLLLLVIGGLVYWCCKRPRYDLARPAVSVTYTALESQSMMQTREAAIGADKYSALGWKTAGIQEPVCHRHMVNDNDMQQAFATALLNQLEDMGVDVTGHCRRLMAKTGCRTTVKKSYLKLSNSSIIFGMYLSISKVSSTYNTNIISISKL